MTIATITRSLLRSARELHISALSRVGAKAQAKIERAYDRFDEAADLSRWANENKKIVRAEADKTEREQMAVIYAVEEEIRQAAKLIPGV